MGVGFIKNTLEQKSPLVEETFTNAICYGQTGSGKTTGFILPNIEHRIKLGHGVLIYDFKGNIHEQVKVIAHDYGKLDDVYEVGKSWGKNIDILKYANLSSLQTMFNSISSNRDDTYWSNSAYMLFENIFYLLKHLLKALDIVKGFDLYCLGDVTYFPDFHNKTPKPPQYRDLIKKLGTT